MIVEREFHTATVHQGYIEPQNATALWNPDGQHDRSGAARRAPSACATSWPSCCRCRSPQIKVIPMEIGGGFGGKISVYLEPLAALLSRKSGHQPVKMTMSRAEVLAATGPTSGLVHPRQDGRGQRRPHHRRRGLPGLRGRRLSRLAGRRRDAT